MKRCATGGPVETPDSNGQHARAVPAARPGRECERHQHHRGGDQEREGPVDQERQPVVEHPHLLSARQLSTLRSRYERGRKRLNEACIDCYKVGRRAGDGGARCYDERRGDHRAPSRGRHAHRAGGREDPRPPGRGARGRGRASCASPSRAAAARGFEYALGFDRGPRRATTSCPSTASRSSSTPTARPTSRAPRSTSSTASRPASRSTTRTSSPRAAAGTPSRWTRARSPRPARRRCGSGCGSLAAPRP